MASLVVSITVGVLRATAVIPNEMWTAACFWRPEVQFLGMGQKQTHGAKRLEVQSPGVVKLRFVRFLNLR